MPVEKPSEKKPAAPQPIVSASVEGALYASAVDRLEGRIFSGGSSGTWYSLDVNAPTPRMSPRGHADSYIGAMGIVGDASTRRQLVVGRYDGSLSWYDLHDGSLVRTIAAHAGWITDLDVLPPENPIDCVNGGETLVTVGHDMLVKTWDARTGALRHQFAGHKAETPEGYLSALYAVAASPREPIIASGDRAGEVRVWDLRNEREIAKFTCGDFYTFDAVKRDRSMGGVRRLRFSPDGTKLAVAGIGAVSNVDGFVGPNRLEVWDWRAGKRLAVLQDSHNGVLNDVRWTRDGKHLIAGGGGDAGGLLISWSVAELASGGAMKSDVKPLEKIKLKGHPHRLHLLDGDRGLAVVGFGGVQVWNTGSLIPVALIPAQSAVEEKGKHERT
jgi:WD40 repeat protein